MKKGRQPLLYTVSSIVSWAVDTGTFFLLRLLLGPALGNAAETICNVTARVVSSFLNFNLNNRLVFKNTGNYGRALFRYYCLAIPQLAVSTLLLNQFVDLLTIESAHGSTAVKIAVDACLYVASFFIQKFWVFSQKGKTADAKSGNNTESLNRKEKNNDL